ncbi:MAG TPA: hypothetical protein VEW42_04810 [Candidatus Eisenbacteria bacterium]|nr:hypothetical protein [Candidatus Eisenbacteria bacterium]
MTDKPRFRLQNINSAVKNLPRVLREEITKTPTVTLSTQDGSVTVSRGFRGRTIYSSIAGVPLEDIR